MSISTSVGIILGAKHLFRWIDEHDSIPWTKPRCFQRTFSIKRKKMVTDAERSSVPLRIRNAVSTFAIEELAHLYDAADGRVRD